MHCLSVWPRKPQLTLGLHRTAPVSYHAHVTASKKYYEFHAHVATAYRAFYPSLNPTCEDIHDLMALGTIQLPEACLSQLELDEQHQDSLASWLDFWSSYGLNAEDMAKMLSKDVLQAGAPNVYTAGEAILFFKQYGGYRDQDIRGRIISYYPYLLTKSVDHDFLPIVQDLESAGCCGKQLQLLVWEFPRIFQHDYKRHIRKFARLGVYGLSLDRLPRMH